MSSLIYLPCSSFSSEDLQSLVKLCLSDDSYRVDTHGGRKAGIKYLINLHKIGFDLSPYINANEIKNLENKLNELKQFDLFKKEFDINGDYQFEEYWEIKSNSPKIHQLAKNARQFIRNSFQPEQLKIYFNSKQIENIRYSQANYETTGFVDHISREHLNKYPLDQRQNQGEINTKQGRIENVIFDIPSNKQIIILDFADERMPGGLFLYGASTQEETICYNSDTYKALLDFKYQRFDGGFFIPEFGCLYIKNVQFSKPTNARENRSIDVIAAACYDLTGEHGLHKPPQSSQQIEINTKKKLEAVVAAAQANTDGNGENTYLILGPIGCGAFKNNLQTIARLWAEVLLKPLNPNLNTQQKHVFERIWFLSGTDQKLKVFEDAFNLSDQQRS